MEGEKRTWGYARVSSAEQNLARQIDELGRYVDDERNILCDGVSR